MLLPLLSDLGRKNFYDVFRLPPSSKGVALISDCSQEEVSSGLMAFFAFFLTLDEPEQEMSPSGGDLPDVDAHFRPPRMPADQ